MSTLTDEDFTLLALRLDNIKAVAPDRFMEDAFQLVFLALANWIRAAHLAFQAVAGRDDELADGVRDSLGKHLELIRTGLGTIEVMLAESRH